MKHQFKANSWLSTEKLFESRDKTSELMQYATDELNLSNFNPPHFFTPGWKGDSLFSKEAVHAKKLLEALWEDARTQFKSFTQVNRSLESAIYEQFKSYTEYLKIDCYEIQDFYQLLSEVKNPKSANKEILQEFTNIYCYRTVAIYLFKLKFIVDLGQELNIDLEAKNLLNPNYFLSKIFPRLSLNELHCESLKSNLYGWFRPSSLFEVDLMKLKENFNSISITELMKVCTYKSEKEVSSPADLSFSHAISHKSFGLMINQLLVNFPKWLEGQSSSCSPNNNTKILNTKFLGEDLTSMAQSHWLAQEDQLDISWKHLLCPNFEGEEFSNGTFIKICHELYFLSFLIKFSQKFYHRPVPLISSVMKDKYSQTKDQAFGQMSMFGQNDKSSLLYDRIVLNIGELPRKNPHHYLLSKISEQIPYMNNEGYLCILSNQKLFVPSKSDKVEQLLTEVSLEGNFNLESLRGKGELPSYIYIFSRNISSPLENPSKNQIKRPCLTFRWHGDLDQFQQLSLLLNELNTFFKSKPNTIPIFQSEVKENLSFEFHQDAILNGKLLHSANKDPSKITHPSFFKNLTKSCIPLEQLFYITSLKQEDQSPRNIITAPGLLGIQQQENEENYPFILIVNYSNSNNIKLELIHAETYKATTEKYGFAYFMYFGVIPKKSELNINIIRDFFNSEIGKQIIQLSISGGLTKIKSKLRAMLVPKFFTKTKLMPEHIFNHLNLLKSDEKTILSIHPEKIETMFDNALNLIMDISSQYTWQIINMLSEFKHNLEKSCNDIDISTPSNINYNNPIIIDSLLKLKTSKIYPQNEEVFIDLTINHKSEVHYPLTSTKLKSENGSDFLELFSGEMSIVKIYSHVELLKFMQFVMNSSKTLPVSTLLQSIGVPSIAELTNIVSNYKATTKTLQKVLNKTIILIDEIITQQISKNNF